MTLDARKLAFNFEPSPPPDWSGFDLTPLYRAYPFLVFTPHLLPLAIWTWPIPDWAYQ
jgi:hypothetical protein